VKNNFARSHTEHPGGTLRAYKGYFKSDNIDIPQNIYTQGQVSAD